MVDVVGRGVDVEMDEYTVPPESPLCGQELKASGIREQTQAMVVAIKRQSGETVLCPGPGEVVGENDLLILIGPGGFTDRLNALRLEVPGEDHP